VELSRYQNLRILLLGSARPKLDRVRPRTPQGAVRGGHGPLPGYGPYIDSNVVLELPAVRKDSEEITVEISLSPISLSHTAEYRGPLALAIIRDVTERKQAEMRAKEAEFRYRALVENIPAIVYIVDVETQATLYDSPQIEAMLGYPANTCERDPHYWEKILHPGGNVRRRPRHNRAQANREGADRKRAALPAALRELL
jgi:PAS domain-containing protein